MEIFLPGHYLLARIGIQRGLAAIYAVAFLVTFNQFRALLGERGLLPVPPFLRWVRFREAPSLFHLYYSDRFLQGVALGGLALSLFALSGASEDFGTPVSMATWGLLWVLYLSVVNVGQAFYAFGWESMLLETGFLALFLGGARTEPPVAVMWLMRWVLFRSMFGAGLIKLRGDPCWRKLTCTCFHYETQPLPNPLSGAFHRLPAWWHRGEVLVNHVVELGAPWLLFLPSPLAGAGALAIIAFQVVLILSGNLSWLNYLTLVQAFAAFDDALLVRWLPVAAPAAGPRPAALDVAIAALVALVLALSLRPVRNMWNRRQVMNRSFDPLHLVNTYGAFGAITRRRVEVVVQGSDDAKPGPGTVWKEYAFRAKPGDPRRRPPWIAPYHLRLDWLMWFLPFDAGNVPLWFARFMEKLLRNDGPTLSLLAGNPFAGRAPASVRARLYLYAFTTRAERRAGAGVWKRRDLGSYFGPVSARGG